MRFSFGLFSTIVTALISLGHIYVYRRLFRDTGAPRALRIAGILVLVLLGPGFIVVRQLFWPLPWPWGGIVTAAQWTWIVAALYLFGTLLAGDVAKLALRRRTRDFSAERRRFLALASAGTASAVTASAIGYGLWRAYEAPVLRELAIRLPKLPRSLDGFSIVQLTDIHVGSVIQRRFVEELVSRANAARPDLVAITGDLVDSDPEHIGEAVAALTALRSRHGTYFVTGNHEYHSDDLRWCAVLEGMGLNVLRNRAVAIGSGTDAFDLVGVDDWGGARRRGGRGYDLQRALAGTSPERARVLLAHQPANFVEGAAAHVGLQLSGHTHGGQVFPMTELIRLHWEHAAGH